jgi:hypothetical protein
MRFQSRRRERAERAVERAVARAADDYRDFGHDPSPNEWLEY